MAHEPNWKDVRWDHRASDAAAAALGRAAAEIDQALADETLQAQGAGAHWRGGSRDAFEGRRAPLRAELRELAEACRAAAGQVRRASVQAAEEQRRREREREEWEREQRRRRSHVA